MYRTLLLLGLSVLLTACSSTEKAGEKEMKAGAAKTPPTPAPAAAVTKDEPKPLTIGDEAPAIDIEHWVIGEPIDRLSRGDVYVVEFWATWCPPCLTSMPHLSSLQDQWGEQLTIIGISNEELPTVAAFLDKADESGATWRDRIHYRLTTDPDKSVMQDYFYAAGQRGIPTAFIVGRTGRVEWIGHPMRMDEPLEQVIKGGWDYASFKSEWEREQKGERLMREAMGELREAERKEDWPAAIAVMDRVLAEQPGQASLAMHKFQTLLGHMNQPEKAYAYAGEIAKLNWDNAMFLNGLAWYIVDDPAVEVRNLPVAMKFAKRASELTEEKDASILDTLARVHYEQGDLESAVKWQAKAAKLVEPGPMAEGIAETLKKYKAEAGGQ